MLRPDENASDPLERDLRAAHHLPPLDDDFPPTPPPVCGLGSDPNRLGKYVLFDRIDCGGMATVYQAIQGGSGKTVAVKSSRPEEASPLLNLRFRREVAIAAGLDHDNIVRIYDADEDSGRPFLVMELLAGLPMHLLLPRGPMRREDACEAVRQIAVGLAFANGKGIVHRDIKPGNAFLTTSGVVKILDWGLAKQAGHPELTDPGQGVGTPPFTPPEQWADMSTVDLRADLYALGVTLWALLLGHTPGKGESIPSDLPPNLGALLRRMLAPDPNARPVSAEEVIDGLTPFCAGHDLPVLVGGPAKLSGNVELWWWDEQSKSERLLHEAGALPMPLETRFRIEAWLNRPAHVYLLWIASDGKLYPMYGWQTGSAILSPDPALSPVPSVELPGAGNKMPLEGAAGTETVVLLARETPLTEAELPLIAPAKAAKFSGKLSREPKDERRTYIFPALGTRLPGAAVAIEDPVELLHDALRDLHAKFDVVKAVSFANSGKERGQR